MPRKQISSPERARHSKRAAEGRLEVIRETFKCEFCSHDKAFKKRGNIQCTRCKKWASKK